MVPSGRPGRVRSAGSPGRVVEIIFTGRPAGGAPAASDEASDVAWFAPGELDGLDVHPTQRRQLGDWLRGRYPHFD
jgi:hypothetical protein